MEIEPNCAQKKKKLGKKQSRTSNTDFLMRNDALNYLYGGTNLKGFSHVETRYGGEKAKKKSGIESRSTFSNAHAEPFNANASTVRSKTRRT